MAFRNQNGYAFNRASVLANAPNASGVYGIYRQGVWIYVGQSKDIQARLMQYINGENACILRNQPTGFTYDLAPEWQLDALEQGLIVGLNPACNQRVG
ncbi:MAG: hypothetical protein ACLPTQ_20260 [Terriglobales bacterium]